jgi:GTP:adenosylcobinamide-phosphate guanylyltransferase
MDDFSALVLAGRRGYEDPLAEAHGSSHRALLDVAGTPMLVRVVRSLRRANSVGRITVSIDEPDVLDDVPELSAMVSGGALSVHRSLASPSRSVADALAGMKDERVLVTTADHALLTPELVDYFTSNAAQAAADVVVGVVEEALIAAAFPSTTRTYLRFRGKGYSGANLFAFQAPSALRAAAFWIKAERFRKQPWRLVGVFGPMALLGFALRRLSLDSALARASDAIGCSVRAVRLPFAEAAVDVDRPSDLELVTRILAERESADERPD